MLTAIILVILLFSAVLHEVMHGLAAYYLGDPTAKLSGRLTLNPIPHLDLYGSILIPGLLILSGAPIFFAYAKPVPINPNFFKNYRRDTMLTALAGPLTNLGLALIFLFAIKLSFLAGQSINSPFTEILAWTVLINLALMAFNLLPIPPLDGSKALGYIFPGLLSPEIERNGWWLLVAVLIFGQAIISGIIFAILTFVLKLFGLVSLLTLLR